MKKIIGIVIKGLLLIIIAAIGTFCAAGSLKEEQYVIPAGWNQHFSTYVAMEDGTCLAARISLPYDLEKQEKVLVILETIRYGTENEMSFILKALVNLSIGTVREPVFLKKR